MKRKLKLLKTHRIFEMPKLLGYIEQRHLKHITQGQQLTAVWCNGGCSASYDSFVGKQTVVLRINICAKNPPLSQATNRYQQP